MNKKYKKSELNIHTYGGGRNKKFIIYTDGISDEFGTRTYNTRIYPDVVGNKANAITESLRWLNIEDVGEPWIVRGKPSKIFISYQWGR